MKSRKIKHKSRIRSFRFAFNGLRILFTEESNARVHLFFAVVIIILGIILNISRFEWLAVVFAIGLVMCLEIINSALERIGNLISHEENINIGKMKDLAAAGVLIGSITAAAIGLIIFIPELLDLL